MGIIAWLSEESDEKDLERGERGETEISDESLAESFPPARAGAGRRRASSRCSVLTEDEKELGACLVDIGGGTTDIAVFHDGAIKHTAVIPIAGDQVTNDIAMALRTRASAS